MGKIGGFLYHLAITVLIALAMFFLAMAFKEQYPLWENQRELEQLQSDVETKKKKDEYDWKKLKKINPDIVGWIKVPGTKIDYPILKGKEWNEYLHKNYKGEYSYPGSIFIQPDTSFEDKHLIIYGHNMRIKSMFGSLHKFESESFYKEHHTVLIYQPDRTIKAKVYSTYDCIDKTDTYKTEFTGEEWTEWLNGTKEKNSYYPIKRIPKEKNNVVTLSTCSGGGKGENVRYVVHATVTKVIYYD